MGNFDERKSGSVLIGVIILAILIAIVVGNYLQSASHEYKMSRRTLNLQSALNLAEAGLEEAFLGMETDTWTGWTTVGTDVYYKSEEAVSFSDGSTGGVTVYLDESGSMPVIVSQGTVTDGFGNQMVKQLFISLKTRSLFANGLTAKDSIEFKGSNVVIDSYDSTVGPYDGPSGGGTNYDDEGSVASIAVYADAVSVGNGTVWGSGSTGGGAPDVGSQGWIGPDDGSRVRGTYDADSVTTDFTSDFPEVDMPSNSVDYTSMTDNGTVGVAGASVPTVYEISGDYGNRNHDMLTIDGPIIVIINGDLDIKGEIEITEDGSAEFYIEGDADFGGNGVANATNVPEALQVYGTSTTLGAQTIKISGNAQANFVVYAPYSEVEMKGGGSSGEMSGAVVAASVVMTGNANFHYDVNLKNFDSDGSYQLGFWQELKGDNQLDFSSTSALGTGVAAIVSSL